MSSEFKQCKICGSQMKKGMASVCSYQCEVKRQQERPVKVRKPRKCVECNKETPARNKYCTITCSKKAERRRKQDKKKLEPGYWMDKADTLASRHYRSETPYCELKDKPHEYRKDPIVCTPDLQWMHVFGRRYKGIRYEPYNKLVGCSAHHAYFTRNTEEWAIFMITNYPERWELASSNRLKYCKANVQYFQSWINHFNEV